MGQLMDQRMDLGMGIRHIYPPPQILQGQMTSSPTGKESGVEIIECTP